MTIGVRATLLAWAIGLLAAPGAAATTEWDQEKVTAVAGELQQATKELYDAFYRQPAQGIGSGQARAYLELKQQLRRIRRESQHLASSLEKGEGRDETLPIYRNLMAEVRDAQENARRVYSTGPVTEKANVAREALEALTGFYSSD